MAKMSLNTLKALVVSYYDSKMIPGTLSLDYFKMNNIKSHFCVITRDSKTALEFSNLKAAFKFIELLAEDVAFNTDEFYNNFRIVEISHENGHCQVLSVIVNLVDFYDLLIKIQDGKIKKDLFMQDIDFKQYYNEFASMLA